MVFVYLSRSRVVGTTKTYLYLEGIPDFSRCVMLLDAQISGILAVT